MKPGQSLLLVLLITACVPSPNQTQPTSAITPAALVAPTTTGTQSSTSSPTLASDDLEKAPPQRSQYSLDATLDFAAHYLAVAEQIAYTNNSSDPLDELQLIVEAETLRAGFAITSLEGEGVADFQHNPGKILVALAQPLNAGESILLELNYELSLPEGAGILGWTAKQINFVDWYPYVAPYRSGEGWLLNPPGQGEHLAYESADFDVRIQVLNAPASAQVAAPAPAGEAQRYVLNNARRFAWSVSGHYEVLRAQQSDIPISIYFFNEHRDAAEASLQTAVQALEIFTELFAPYPYESLSIVEGQFPDGMESDALFFLDQHYFLTYSYSPRNFLTTLTAHEIAHNWWFGQVGSDPANEPWLDEALCTYSELLFYENAFPGHVDWWWQFRVEDYAPVGWVDSTIYEFSSFRSYVDAVYLRGAHFLRDLRTSTGDDTFFKLLQSHAEHGADMISTTEDFFTLLAQTTDQDLTKVISEYFRTPD